MNRTLFSFLTLAGLLLAGPSQASDRAALVKGNNQFALDLYAKLKAQDGNLFFSPYSISTALAMTYGGARSRTADEMAKTLHSRSIMTSSIPPSPT